MKKTKNKDLHVRLTEELAYEFKVTCAIMKMSQADAIENFIRDFVQESKVT